MARSGDQELEKVPTNLHVRHLTLISHSGWRDNETTTWQSTTKNFTYALILHLTFHSGAKALSMWQSTTNVGTGIASGS
jgi:hypothetical protein